MQTRFAELRKLLATGPLATVATIDPDGASYAPLAWVGFDGDEIVTCSFFSLNQRKLSNMRRDPRVVITVQAKEHTGEGRWPYAVMQCRVDRITEGGTLAMMDRLAEHYIGPGAQYPLRDAPDGVVVHLTIDSVDGQGPWVGTD